MIHSLIKVYSYNSIVYSSISIYHYNVVEMSEQVLGLPFTPIKHLSKTDDKDYFHNMAITPWEMEVLPNEDCIDAYAQKFQVARGNVILVVEHNFTNVSPNDREAWRQMMTLPYYYYSNYQGDGLDEFKWICNWNSGGYGGVYNETKAGTCSDQLPHIKKRAKDWAPFGAKVKYCLSEKPAQQCKLQYNIPIAIIVIAMTALKTVFICIVAFGVKESPILTMGDAVVSFLNKPDKETKRMCLVSKSDIVDAKRKWTFVPRTFKRTRARWYQAATAKRWILCIVLYVLLPPISPESEITNIA